MVPPVDAFSEVRPIGRPAEVGRVDVGGAPFFEAGKLVWPDEVHLAAEHGAIAGGAQIVRGDDGGRKRPLFERQRGPGSDTPLRDLKERKCVWEKAV